MDKEHADKAVKHLQEFLDLDSLLILNENSVIDTLYSIDAILMHLEADLRDLPDSEIYELVEVTSDYILKLRDIIKKDTNRHFCFMEKESELVEKAERKHGRWKAVFREEKREYEANVESLEEIHAQFKELHKLYKKAKTHNVSPDLMGYYKKIHDYIALNEEALREKIEEQAELLAES